jgi:hypothetical protein
MSFQKLCQVSMSHILELGRCFDFRLIYKYESAWILFETCLVLFSKHESPSQDIPFFHNQILLCHPTLADSAYDELYRVGYRRTLYKDWRLHLVVLMRSK